MKKTNKILSASVIAQRSFCEKKLVLDELYGRHESDLYKLRRERGDEQYLRHYLVAQRYGAIRDSRCFIATELYGPIATETMQLRQFRDTVLMECAFGRAFVSIYYDISPSIITLMERSPALKKIIKLIIDLIVKKVSQNE